MFVYLNYFKNQNYHKYTHLLQIHFDFSCADLSHRFHHVNVRHDFFRYFCINFSFYFLTLTVYCVQNFLKKYLLLLLLFIFSLSGLGGISISIVLTYKVKYVQSSRPCRAEWHFHGRRENTYGLLADN